MADERSLPGEARGINVRLDKWRQQIPTDAWPDHLPETGVLWRQDVFAAANNWRASRGSVRALLVTACMWGTGTRGYGPARALAALNADPDGTKLEHNLKALRQEHPSEDDLLAAYQMFNKASPTHLHRLGPAFFSKLLYFAGYRRSVGGVQPLILDKLVAGGLPAEAGPACALGWGWPSVHWIAYLRWAARQASRPEFGGEPDAVEMALFNGEWKSDDH